VRREPRRHASATCDAKITVQLYSTFYFQVLSPPTPHSHPHHPRTPRAIRAQRVDSTCHPPCHRPPFLSPRPTRESGRCLAWCGARPHVLFGSNVLFGTTQSCCCSARRKWMDTVSLARAPRTCCIVPAGGVMRNGSRWVVRGGRRRRNWHLVL